MRVDSGTDVSTRIFGRSMNVYSAIESSDVELRLYLPQTLSAFEFLPKEVEEHQLASTSPVERCQHGCYEQGSRLDE